MRHSEGEFDGVEFCGILVEEIAEVCGVFSCVGDGDEHETLIMPPDNYARPMKASVMMAANRNTGSGTQL